MTTPTPPGGGFSASWPLRRVAVALIATAAFALAIGIPTGVLPTPLYTRMTPVLWWNYPVWAVTAILSGLLTATYVRRPQEARARNGVGAASGGGLLAAFAVGCPVCNKLVVAALGVSGAISIWAPLQPVLAVASVLLLAWSLRRRLRNARACPLPRPILTTPAITPAPHDGAAAVVAPEEDARTGSALPESHVPKPVA